MNQSIINFYTGVGTDDAGRSLEDIMLWGSDDLESCHTYVQWLFPLKEKSAFNPAAPILDDETIEAFTDNSKCRKNLIRATERMLDFYELKRNRHGFRSIPGKLVGYGDQIKPSKPWWIEKNDHNYLRITRMLTCLNMLDCGIFAEMIYQLLTELYQLYEKDIGPNTYQYWYVAAWPKKDFDNSLYESEYIIAHSYQKSKQR